MITLYHFAKSGHAHRARLFLSLLGTEHTVHEVALAKGEHKSDSYRKINPYGQVPSLTDGDLSLADSNAILVYLAEKYDPSQAWYPADPAARGKIQEWLAKATKDLVEGCGTARLITVFGNTSDPEATIAKAHAYLAVVDAALAGRDWLVGDRATIADIANYSYIAHAPEGNVDLGAYANVKAWLARIEALPGFGPTPAPAAALVTPAALPRHLPRPAHPPGGPPAPRRAAMTIAPFHAGEIEAQRRAGFAVDEIAEIGSRMLRDFMPDQHRQFFAQLPQLVVGTVDAGGRPWASMLVGEPGFAASQDPHHLTVATWPVAGDPAADNLIDGADIGVLGIEFHTRRRNRMNGKVTAPDGTGFQIAVVQSFGNCPQYIQARTLDFGDLAADRATPRQVIDLDRLDDRATRILEDADTLFIASRYAEEADRPYSGIDVSHRGGKPGFIRVAEDGTLTIPDFSGNKFFNTFGNLLKDPRAGITVIDFQTGDGLYLTGRAEVIWDGPEVDAFIGAERLLTFRVEAARIVPRAVPARFELLEASPLNARTGDWRQTAETVAAREAANTWRDLTVAAITPEARDVVSVYLKAPDGAALAPGKPGQFLTVKLTGADGAERIRTYTVSDAPTPDYYRLTVKREADGQGGSAAIHALTEGASLKALAPRGAFTLDEDSPRPAVLLSAGIGITPMIAMLNHAAREGVRTRTMRPIYFFHGARDGASMAFRQHLVELDGMLEPLVVRVGLSRPGSGDELGRTHHFEGRLTPALVARMLPFGAYDFYVCGPSQFMADMVQGLYELDVPPARVHYEFFGPASFVPQRPDQPDTPALPPAADADVPVRFAAAGTDAVWTPSAGSLLELAEAQGLTPEFGCRNGGCGSCAVTLTAGSVTYDKQPGAPIGEDQALLCCAKPAQGTEPITLDV